VLNGHATRRSLYASPTRRSSDLEDAGVVDGDGAALDVVQAQLPRPGPFGQVGHRVGQARDAEPVRVVNDGDDQALLQPHRDADVDALLHHDALILPGGVEMWELL